jgi:hypothetical protein
LKTPQQYREEANRCRELLDRQVKPEVRVQLRLWSAELEDIADSIECGAEDLAQKKFARPL